jgi:hypothetical protein
VHTIFNRFKHSYTLDVRALSLMRIAVGLVLLTDLVIRSLSIKAFFTNEGVLPLDILKAYNWNSYYFSFHAMSGELWWQVLLFMLNALCIGILIIGYRARLFTFICWTFLVSLQNRNPFILQGGDDLLRLVLLWGIFLPWGERYSVQKRSAYANDYFSLSGIGYTILVGSVYFFSALLKTSPEWHSEGTALYYALSLDQLRLPLGTFLYRFPGLLSVLTHVVYYVELLAPLLFMMPFMPVKIRFAGVAAIILLHIGISLTIYVGLFYIIGISSLLGLLPKKQMDWLDRRLLRNSTEMVPVTASEQPNGFVYETALTIKNCFLGFIIAYCLILNLGNVRKFPYTLDLYMLKFGSMLRLEQSWGMFSPSILKDDGFFVFSGYTTTGKFIDIKHNLDSVSYAKPAHVVQEYESDRWRKYSENYVFNNNNYMRPYYCRYLINKWNREHPDKHVVDLSIFFMKEISLPNYKTKPLEKLAVCNCQDKK